MTMPILATTLNPIAVVFFITAGLLGLVGFIFWLVDPNRKN